MKTCYNSNGLRTLDVYGAVKAVAAAGYDGIELSLHPQHIDLFSMTVENAGQLRAFIQDQGIEACCLATGYDMLLGPARFEPSLIAPDIRERERRMDAIRKAIDLACHLGIPVVNFASGFLPGGISRETARDILLEAVLQLLDHALTSVTLAIEPEPGFFIESNAQAIDFVRLVGSPHLRINQDIGHENVTEPQYLDSIARTLEYTAHIHIEDIVGRKHYHEIPGDGDIDFPALSACLNASSYAGYLSIELYNHAEMYQSALARSLEYLRAVGLAHASRC